MDQISDTAWYLIAGLGAVVVLALISAQLGRRRHRQQARRLASAVARIDSEAQLDDRADMEELLTKLEAAADHNVLGRNDLMSRAARFAAALDSVGHGVLVTDDTGRIVWRNEPARQLSADAGLAAVVDHELRAIIDQAVAGQPVSRTLELYGPPRRVLQVRAQPLNPTPGTAGVVVIVEDHSERHRVEAMRRDFVANISHELKTPIGALGLLAETLAAEEDPDVAKRLSDRMQRESQRIARVIDDLTDLSRIESQGQPEREPVAVTRLVAEAVERARPLADQRKVTVKRADIDPALSLVCDRRQITSAVFNLIENAVKYSERGTEVEVAAGRDGSKVTIAVTDHGVGIPGSDLERIFERFYRVDRGRSRDTGGTGLGLAIVRHVVANHRGEVRVDSLEGEGSTFTLRFPDVDPNGVASSS